MTATPSKSVSRAEVAQAAGVSVTTVTHALSPRKGESVAPATRQRVRRVAEQLGYRPSFVGRALVDRRNYTIGLLLPSYEGLFREFYQAMVRGFDQAMADTDYHLMLLFRDDVARYERVIDEGRLDGMIILQSDFDTRDIRRVVDRGLPTVVVNKRFDVRGYDKVANVRSDYESMTAQVAQELIDDGRRHILQLNPMNFCDADQCIGESFAAALHPFADRGVFGATVVPDALGSAGQIRAALASGQRWDGVFCVGWHFAEIFVEEARQVGLEPYRDYRMIIESALPPRPPIHNHVDGIDGAFIQQPDRIGATAWQLLDRVMTEPSVPDDQRDVRVPYVRTEPDALYHQSLQHEGDLS